MKAVVFSGTSEGRRLSLALAGMGFEVTVCVATEYGAERQAPAPGLTVHTGRMEAAGMASLLRGAALCVDATHPYAVKATANIQKAAREAGIPYKRLLRPPSPLPQGCLVAESAAQSVELLKSTEGPILLTTGVKELAAFSTLGVQRLFPRVLPAVESLQACQDLDIPASNIIAMQGPFSHELNTALLRQFKIRYLVTKDGGVQGGFPQKVSAAQAAGAALVVIRRPQEEGDTEEEIYRICKGLIVCM